MFSTDWSRRAIPASRDLTIFKCSVDLKQTKDAGYRSTEPSCCSREQCRPRWNGLFVPITPTSKVVEFHQTANLFLSASVKERMRMPFMSMLVIFIAVIKPAGAATTPPYNMGSDTETCDNVIRSNSECEVAANAIYGTSVNEIKDCSKPIGCSRTNQSAVFFNSCTACGKKLHDRVCPAKPETNYPICNPNVID